jgi:putative SOS response-associated peptidase YedK
VLVPDPAEVMEAVAVSPLVNSPKNDGPECLAPAV